MICRWRFFIAPFVLFIFLSTPIVLSAPMSKEQLFQLATLAASDNQFERSIELFQKVIEIDPQFAPAYNGIGLVYQTFEQGDMNEAMRYFRLATDISPEYTESWNNLGRIYYSRSRFHEAEKAFLSSLKVKPQQPDIEFALAWVYLLGQSRPEQAIHYFNKTLQAHENPVIYYGRGLAHLLQGDRFKVLDDVTHLRRHHREEQADTLEKMVRDNVRLSSTPGMPLVTGVPGETSLFDQQVKELESKGFNVHDPEGIKVRLKGPLLGH